MSDPAIHDRAEQFLRAGGIIPWGEWVENLDDEDREAFASAGDRIHRERIGLLASAIHRPTLATDLLEGADPEESLARELAHLVADEVERRIARGSA